MPHAIETHIYRTIGTEYILGGSEQVASKGPNGIFSGCTGIILVWIRTSTEAHTRGLLYRYGTLAGTIHIRILTDQPID